MNRAIIVEEGLISEIQDNLDLLVDDWKREGADEVILSTHPGGVNGDPSAIRTQLQDIPDLEGAFLIGELPVVRIEMEGAPGWFATDYYFMELAGDWEVEEGNYVSCEAYQAPGIFVGRLVVGEMTGMFLSPRPTVPELYNHYLDKLHAYRISASQWNVWVGGRREAALPPGARNGFKAALVNNWGADTEAIAEWLEIAYPQENISVYEDVTRDEYEDIFRNNSFDYLAFRSHSDPGGHDLAEGTRWNMGDYMLVDPEVNFFELTACGTGSIVWESFEGPIDPNTPGVMRLTSDLVAWNIIFSKPGGMLVLAPSISHAMNHTTEFYKHLHEGGTFGRAFRLWAEYMQSFGDPGGWAFILISGDPFIRFDVPNYNCVIYTSVVGTRLEPRLPILWSWKSKVLMSNALGRMAAWIFDLFNPCLSYITMMSKLIRSANRRLISALINIVELGKAADVKCREEMKKPSEGFPTRLTVWECEKCKKSRQDE